MKLSVIFFVFLLTGCVMPPPQVDVQAKFDEEEIKRYSEPGTSGVKGQAFLRQQGGGVVTCAGSEVFLVPATPYYRQTFEHVRAGRNPQLGLATIGRYSKKGRCDAQGNFAFANVRDGPWFVLTRVQWVVGNNAQGGALMQEVAVPNGQTIQVLLTDRDFISR